ncbi:MAG: ABC transporter ATP-binding protein, partial [Pseudomonadales bacterium]
MNDTRIGTRETLRLIRRAMVFVWPVRYQLGVKLALGLIAITALLILPWPLKVLIDHVIMGMPIGDSPTPYPPYFAPFVDMLLGFSPFEIVMVIVVFSLVLIFLIGAFGSGGAARDRTDAGLAEGLDTATRSENMANMSDSSASGLLGFFEFRYQLRTTHRLNHRFRSVLFDRLLAMPMTRFSDASVGDAVYRVLYDTPSISRICYELWVVPILALYTIAVVVWTTSYSFSVVPSVVWAAWAVTPLSLAFSLLMTGLARKRSGESREAGAVTTATVEEGMSNVVAVQSLGANKREQARFEDDSAESFKRFRAYMLVVITVILVQAGIGMAMVFVVFFDVSEAVVAGKMSAGDFGVLFAYFVQLIGNTGALGALWFYLQDSVAAMRRVFQIVDMSPDAEAHGDRVLPPIARGVRLEGVSYAYPDGARALSEVTCEGEIGEMIAFVGATGAGKTTLSYLIPGFISAQSGRVLIDGEDIRTFSIESLRQNVAFVFQEAVAFDDTVESNIRLGYPDASMAEIEGAARTACALEFIERLPDGFQTRVGRAGSTLSVGEKQRL